jgi:hypothetical protein
MTAREATAKAKADSSLCSGGQFLYLTAIA